MVIRKPVDLEAVFPPTTNFVAEGDVVFFHFAGDFEEVSGA